MTVCTTWGSAQTHIPGHMCVIHAIHVFPSRTILSGALRAIPSAPYHASMFCVQCRFVSLYNMTMVCCSLIFADPTHRRTAQMQPVTSACVPASPACALGSMTLLPLCFLITHKTASTCCFQVYIPKLVPFCQCQRLLLYPLVAGNIQHPQQQLRTQFGRSAQQQINSAAYFSVLLQTRGVLDRGP